ncbi:MAG: FecR domain-containing protein [Gammaproteobacteria bacterium]|nr:FecR domain-containing protein [Gammaproteobacteria bacterium]
MNKQLTIQEQAAYYVTRIHSGELSAQEEREILAWRKLSPQHETEFQTMLNLWDLSNNLYQPVKSKYARKRRYAFLGLSTAASVALTAMLIYVLNPLVSVNGEAETSPLVSVEEYSDSYQEVIVPDVAAPKIERRYVMTGSGEVDTVGLSDGSSVTLNTQTVLQVAFNEQERNVILLEGEAFFDVTSDPSRPFIIDTGSQKIRVIGTKFNVRKSNGDVRVAVVEGTVSVSRSQRSDDDAQTEVSEPSDYVLNAGSVGSFSNTAEVVVPSSFEQVTDAQSWRQGVFRFDEERLEVVVKEFNRYRTRKLRIVDAEAAELRISGVFHFGQGEGLVDALRATLPIEIEETNNELLVRVR